MRGSVWQQYRFLFPVWKISSLAVMGTAAALAVGLSGRGRWPESGLLLLIFCVLALLVFLHDLETMRRGGAGLRRQAVATVPLGDLGLSATAAGYARISFGGRYAISSPQVNSLLNAKEVPLTIERDRYRLPDQVRSLAPFLLRSAHSGGKILFNEPKLRLVTDLTPALIERGEPVRLQRTDYFSSLISNELAAVQIEDADGEILLRGLDLVAADGVAFDLADSPCSNHLGVSALAFTAEGHLVLTQTSVRSAQNAGQLTPAASGSISPADLKELARPSLQRLAAAAIGRELREEIGLTGRSDVQINTRLIGFARFLNRAGKPELYGVSALNVPLAELKIDDAEKDLVDKIKVVPIEGYGPEAISKMVHNLLEHGRASLSPALYLNLTFFAAYLRSNPQLISKLLPFTGRKAGMNPFDYVDWQG